MVLHRRSRGRGPGTPVLYRIGCIGWIVGLALLLTACGASGPRVEPAPAGRLEYSGFSFEAPAGAGWEMQRSADGAMFRKELGSPQHTLVALVTRSTGFDPAAVGYAAYATDPKVFAEYVHAAGEHAGREVADPPRRPRPRRVPPVVFPPCWS